MNVVLLGAGGHAKVVIETIERAGLLRIAGLIDRSRAIGERLSDYEVLGRDVDLPQLMARHDVQGAVVALGDNWLRAKIATSLASQFPTLSFPNVIHPSAQVARSVVWGRGNVVMAGAVVNSDTIIGDFCILNTCCSIDHDGRLDNFASFAPQSCAGGNVHVGEYAAICLGAKVIHGLRIGAHTVVGAGATVVKDLPPSVVAFGTPARPVRPRQPGERYL